MVDRTYLEMEFEGVWWGEVKNTRINPAMQQYPKRKLPHIKVCTSLNFVLFLVSSSDVSIMLQHMASLNAIQCHEQTPKCPVHNRSMNDAPLAQMQHLQLI